MKRPGPILLLTCLLPAIAQTPVAIAYRIDSAAGMNATLEGVPALEEYISYPNSIAVDKQGNVYYNDGSRCLIRKIDTAGMVTTVAGNGTSGYSGDGGPATAAQINGDANIAVGASGNLYLADTYNLVVRRVTPDGIIRTIAGTGRTGGTGDGGPALAASLNLMGGIALDAQENVYIVTVDGRLRKITADGKIDTIAGTGTPGFSGDGGDARSARINGTDVAADGDGNVFIIDLTYRVRKVTPDGLITTVAGTGQYGAKGEGDGGPAISAKLGGSGFGAIDGKGGLYLPEPTGRVRHVRADGIIETVAGTGLAGFSGDGGAAEQAKFNIPNAAAVGPDGSLYITDLFNHRIRKVNPEGVISTFAGRGRYAGDQGSASAAILNDPVGVALDGGGSLYFSESYGARIRRVDTNGTIITVAGTGKPGQVSVSGPDATQLDLVNPGAMAADAAGNVYFVEGLSVRRLSPSGELTTFAGNGQLGRQGDNGPATSASFGGIPQGLAVDAAGSLYIADSSNSVIRQVTADGNIRTIAGTTGTFAFGGDGGPATSARLSYPRGIAFDMAGNLFVVDSNNRRVRRIALDGTITTVAGNGRLDFLDNGWPVPQGDGGKAVNAQLFGPVSVAVDSAGSIFIGEHQSGYYFGNRIRRVTPDGLIETVAGTGDYGYSGDGGLARYAQLHWVSQLASNANGQVYFADRLNYRVRVLTPIYGTFTPPSTSGGASSRR